MTDIVFVNATESLAIKEQANGTMLLATNLLRAGFDVEVLRFCEIESYHKDYHDFIRDITDRLLSYEPKSVSFYSLWPAYHIMLRIAMELRQQRPEIILVFGGPQASATATDTLNAFPCVDYICTGEGEHTVVPFFTSILRNDCRDIDSIPGLYHRRDGSIVFNNIELPLCDLNTLPYWDDRLFADYYRNPEPNIRSRTYFMPIDAGRGCPYSCTFCCTSHFWRRTYRLKSPERIVADIRFYKEKFGITSFWFSHDAFATNRKLVSDVCDRILEEGLEITWECTTRIDCLSEELALKMKKAGMVRIDLGIETGSARMQKRINKNLNLSKAREMISFLLKNGLFVGLFCMYGFPDETEEELNETLELMFSLYDMGVQHISMSFCRFNPITDMTEEYFDRLVFDPKIKKLTRNIYGYQEETQMFRDHKAIFPFYYHLPTPLRDEFQYLAYFTYLYEQYPTFMHQLRKHYHGDNLKFFRDFYYNNLPYFERDLDYLLEGIRSHVLEMMDNAMKDLDVPYLPQLKALLKYERDTRRVRKSKVDITLRDTYDFSYYDLKLRLPIDQYSQGQTEILLQKTNGKTSIKILRIS